MLLQVETQGGLYTDFVVVFVQFFDVLLSNSSSWAAGRDRRSVLNFLLFFAIRLCKIALFFYAFGVPLLDKLRMPDHRS